MTSSQWCTVGLGITFTVVKQQAGKTLRVRKALKHWVGEVKTFASQRSMNSVYYVSLAKITHSRHHPHTYWKIFREQAFSSGQGSVSFDYHLIHKFVLLTNSMACISTEFLKQKSKNKKSFGSMYSFGNYLWRFIYIFLQCLIMPNNKIY